MTKNMSQTQQGCLLGKAKLSKNVTAAPFLLEFRNFFLGVNGVLSLCYFLDYRDPSRLLLFLLA